MNYTSACVCLRSVEVGAVRYVDQIHLTIVVRAAVDAYVFTIAAPRARAAHL